MNSKEKKEDANTSMMLNGCPEPLGPPNVTKKKIKIGRSGINITKEALKKKKQTKEHQIQTEEQSSTVTTMIVPRVQEFSAIAHEFEPIFGGEEQTIILKMPTENFLFPLEKKIQLVWFLY